MSTETWSDFGDEVLSHLQKLKKLQGLHLASVAKAIELTLKENIKIIFWGEPEHGKSHDITGVTMSQECRVFRPGCAESAPLVEHFIFYSESRDSSDTRFYVAHELGHILMHHPQESHAREPVVLEGHDEANFYVLKYTDKEEAEADMFAAILIEERPAPKHPAPANFDLPSKKTLKNLKKRGLLCSALSKQVSD